MCIEVIKEDGKALTTPRELAAYLKQDCTVEGYRDGWDEEQLKNLPIDWRDCCLCGVDVEGLCKAAGKEVEWGRDGNDPMALFIKGNFYDNNANARRKSRSRSRGKALLSGR